MERSENDFSQGSLAKAILRLAIPMTTAQLIQVTYSVIDRMYLGRLPGHLALTGLGLCTPILSIISAFANLCGMGGAPLCSICLGKGDREESERIMGSAFALLLLFGGVLTVAVLLFKTPLLYAFGAGSETFPFADAYLTIYACGTFFVMIGLGMNPFINAQGYGKIGMCSVVLGAVTNIVLDPLLIFTFGLGVQGAALATVISQACSAVWVLCFLMGRRSLCRMRSANLRLNAERLKRIVSLGASGFTISMTNSVVQVLCNITLQAYGGDAYVGVMTVVNSVQEIAIMPLQGLTNGCQPVLGYNYGAGEFQRVRKGIHFTTTVTLTCAAAACIGILAVPELLIRAFNSEGDMLAIGVPALRIFFSTFFFRGFQVAGQGVFVGLGKARSAIIFSLLRKVFIVAPLALLLPRCGLGASGVFTAEAVSNVISGTACVCVMYASVYRPLGTKKTDAQRGG